MNHFEKVSAIVPSADGFVGSFDADVHPDWTIGGKPNTDFIESSLGADALTASKHVRVLPTFQLGAHPRVYAAGDVVEWREQKQAAKIPGHVDVVVKNVLAALEGRTVGAVYKGAYEIIGSTSAIPSQTEEPSTQPETSNAARVESHTQSTGTENPSQSLAVPQ